MNDEGKRHKFLDNSGENTYTYISSSAVSMAICYENRPENRKIRRFVDHICENATSLLESGASMEAAATYVEQQNNGKYYQLGKMAEIMREYCR